VTFSDCSLRGLTVLLLRAAIAKCDAFRGRSVILPIILPLE
jgi:hypothetical protein